VSISGHTFGISGFSDPDGDALGSSHWQIGTDTGFGTLILERILDGEESLTIGLGILKSNTTYTIRTRQKDSTGLWSDWSTAATFTTASNEVNDADGNGIDDRYQVSGSADADKNGVSDSSEGICNLTDVDGTQILGFRSNIGTIHCFSVLNDVDLPAGSTTADFPYGLFSFVVEDLVVDQNNPVTVNVTIYFEGPVAAETRWYKYDPSTGTVTDYTSNVSINGNAVVVTLKDGGSGDVDGVVNGKVVDPSGPSFTTGGGDTTDGSTSDANVASTDVTVSAAGAMTMPFLLILVWLGYMRKLYTYRNVKQ